MVLVGRVLSRVDKRTVRLRARTASQSLQEEIKGVDGCGTVARSSKSSEYSTLWASNRGPEAQLTCALLPDRRSLAGIAEPQEPRQLRVWSLGYGGPRHAAAFHATGNVI
jgi:hypothetical protein